MVTIYEKSETSFEKNGLGTIQLLSCIVTEELNGIYELDGSVLVNVPKSENIVNENILKVLTPNGYQLFRIFQNDKNIDATIINFRAKHIFYDLLKRNLSNINVANTSIQSLGNTILSNTDITTPFTFNTNLTTTSSFKVSDINAVNAFMGDESILSITNGEILRDNFNISINNTIGADKGFSIRYAKNLTGLVYEESTESLITRIKPIASNENDTPLYLPETYIDSGNIGTYGILTTAIKYTDLKVGSLLDDVPLTVNQIHNLMRSRVLELYNKGVDRPTVSMKISFILLTDTTKYKDFKMLENIMLGDIVNVIHMKNNINVKTNVIKYEFNSLINRYESIELGTAFAKLSNILSVINSNANTKSILSLIAKDISYDNAGTTLLSTNVQDVITELQNEITQLNEKVNNLSVK